MVAHGKPATSFTRFGERVLLEIRQTGGTSRFEAVDVDPAAPRKERTRPLDSTAVAARSAGHHKHCCSSIVNFVTTMGHVSLIPVMPQLSLSSTTCPTLRFGAYFVAMYLASAP